MFKNKKRYYTGIEKSLYYEKLAYHQYRKNYYYIKNYNRNWWRYYYYQGRSAGYDHKKAFAFANDCMKDSKKHDENRLKLFIKLKRDLKISPNRINPDYVYYDLMEEYLKREIKKMKKNIKKKGEKS